MITSQMGQVLGMRPKALLVTSMLGILDGIRVCVTPSRPQNLPLGRQSRLTHPVQYMTLRRAAISTSLLQDLDLVSSKTCPCFHTRAIPDLPTILPAATRSDQPARHRLYHSEHVIGLSAPPHLPQTFL